MIELLIAISIMAILAGIGTYSYTNAQIKARDARRKTDLSQIKAGLQLYFEDNKAYPPTTAGSPPSGCNETFFQGNTYTACPSDGNGGTNWIGPDLATYIQKLPKDPKQAAILTQLANTIPKFNFGQIQQNIKSTIASLLPKFGGKEEKPQGQVAAVTVQGPNNPTLAVNAGSGIDWVNPTNAFSSNNVYATADLTVTGSTKYLRLTGFGFTVPDTAQILGITVQVEGQIACPSGCSTLSRAHIVKNGIESVSKPWWPFVLENTTTIGSSTDLWSNTWTPAEIRAANFGVSLYGSGSGATYKVDHVKISITYDPNPPQPNLYANTLVTKTGNCATGTATSTFAVGQNIVLCANMGNNGAGSASNFYWRSYRALTSAPNSGTASDFNNGPNTWAAGTSYTATTAMNTTTSTSGCTAAGGGNYTCTAYVFMDATGVASETNETDNIASINYTVSTGPSLTNTAVTTKTATTATLPGTFNPNGVSTTAWFRYHTTNAPGNTCNGIDSTWTGSTRAPASGGTTFTDSISHAYSQSITGLTPSTTYYFCAIGQNTSSVFGTNSNAPFSFITNSIPPPTCSAAPNPSNTNQLITFTGAASSSTYNWSAPGSTNPSGTNVNPFSTSYASNGAKIVTVTDPATGLSGNCSVQINLPLTCSPSSASGITGQAVSFTASGGTGSYSWSAPNGSPGSGGGSAFSTTYTTAGSYTVQLSDGSATVSCTAVITPPSLPSDNACYGKNFTYCYVALPRNAAGQVTGFVVWAHLENSNDPEIYTRAGAACGAGETSPDFRYYNYCVKSE